MHRNYQCMYLAIKLWQFSGAFLVPWRNYLLLFALYVSQRGLTCSGISHFLKLQTGLEKTSSYLISDYSFFLTRNYKQHVLKSCALSCLYLILALRQKQRSGSNCPSRKDFNACFCQGCVKQLHSSDKLSTLVQSFFCKSPVWNSLFVSFYLSNSSHFKFYLKTSFPFTASFLPC